MFYTAREYFIKEQETSFDNIDYIMKVADAFIVKIILALWVRIGKPLTASKELIKETIFDFIFFLITGFLILTVLNQINET